MAFTVETGTGISGANSFATVAEFQTYHADRGNTTIAEADTDQIQAALIKAADYMEQAFRMLWRGSRAQENQRLSWPRRGVPVPDFFDPFYRDLSDVPLSFQDTLWIAENEIPTEVKEAQFLIAAETFSGALSTGVIQPALGRETKREKLGVLEVEYFDVGQGGGRQTTKYWNAEGTIDPFLDWTRKFGGAVVRN
jgi:hypothetical protein